MSEEYTTGTGQRIFKVHASYLCQGPWCVIHNPAPGPWSSWPTHWIGGAFGEGTNGALVRLCPHGFAHPVVEDNVPQAVTPHHAECDGCPCGPEHIGMRVDYGPVGTLMGYDVDTAAPLDYNGNPAPLQTTLTPAQIFQLDQDSAAVENALSYMVGILVESVIASKGKRVGHHAVPAPWLDSIRTFDDVQIKALLQYACWHLADASLRAAEANGTLEQTFGIRLEEDWHDPLG